MRIPIANLLVRNPLAGIGTFMDRVQACAGEVPELVRRLVQGDQLALEEQAKRVSKLEADADAAKNELRDSMPIRLYLPVDRRDVLKLLSSIDAIADSAEDVGVLLTLRKMEVPEEFETLLPAFVDRVVECVNTAADLVGTFDSLLAAGFRGTPATRARDLIEEVARKEHEADKLQDQLAKILFRLESTLPPVALFMWLKVLEELGDMANHAENVGDQFRLFLAE